MRKVDHIVVHCAATYARQDIGAEDIDRWHRAKKWLGNGYHYVIRRDGRTESHATGERCRPLDKPGAHVGDCGRGWNKRSIGICLAGGLGDDGHMEYNYTDEQMAALRGIIEGLLRQFPDAVVLGHNELIQITNAPNKKVCPCFDVSAWFGNQT